MPAAAPQRAKALGHAVRNFDEQTWRARRFEIVVRAKFGHDPVLKRFPLATGRRVLVEAGPHDRIWGIGPDRS
ncbi:NADAR family protein [Streptosporangium sp. KLBMP 9127]|nr:NADAR family protein [Streptosporangium sp. KLBMP 9127]